MKLSIQLTLVSLIVCMLALDAASVDKIQEKRR
jgi:hypothetical protein